MSIIHDALQKTQQNLKDIRESSIPTKERNGIEWVDGLLILIITCLFFAIAYAYYLRLVSHSSASKPTVTVPAKPIAKKPSTIVQPVIAPQPTVQAVAAPTIVSPPAVQQLPPSVVAVAQPVVTPAPVVQQAQIQQPQIQQLPAQASIQPSVQQAPAMQAALAPEPAVNPFPVAAASSQNRLMLNGVLISDEQKIALINNQPYHLGDMVDDMEIVSIELNTVTLKNAFHTMVLRT